MTEDARLVGFWIVLLCLSGGIVNVIAIGARASAPIDGIAAAIGGAFLGLLSWLGGV